MTDLDKLEGVEEYDFKLLSKTYKLPMVTLALMAALIGGF